MALPLLLLMDMARAPEKTAALHTPESFIPRASILLPMEMTREKVTAATVMRKPYVHKKLGLRGTPRPSRDGASASRKATRTDAKMISVLWGKKASLQRAAVTGCMRCTAKKEVRRDRPSQR